MPAKGRRQWSQKMMLRQFDATRASESPQDAESEEEEGKLSIPIVEEAIPHTRDKHSDLRVGLGLKVITLLPLGLKLITLFPLKADNAIAIRIKGDNVIAIRIKADNVIAIRIKADNAIAIRIKS